MPKASSNYSAETTPQGEIIYNLDSGGEIVLMNLRNAIYSLIHDRKPCHIYVCAFWGIYMLCVSSV